MGRLGEWASSLPPVPLEVRLVLEAGHPSHAQPGHGPHVLRDVEELAEAAGLVKIATHTSKEVFEYENGADFVASSLVADFLLPVWLESLDEKEKERDKERERDRESIQNAKKRKETRDKIVSTIEKLKAELAKQQENKNLVMKRILAEKDSWLEQCRFSVSCCLTCRFSPKRNCWKVNPALHFPSMCVHLSRCPLLRKVC